MADTMTGAIAQVQVENYARQVMNLADVRRGHTIAHEGREYRLDVTGRHGSNKVVVFRAVYQSAELLSQWRIDRQAFEAAMQADLDQFLAARAYFTAQGLTDIPVYMFVASGWDPAVGEQIRRWYGDRSQTINLIAPQA